jgi:hypothetical protein
MKNYAVRTANLVAATAILRHVDSDGPTASRPTITPDGVNMMTTGKLPNAPAGLAGRRKPHRRAGQRNRRPPLARSAAKRWQRQP